MIEKTGPKARMVKLSRLRPSEWNPRTIRQPAFKSLMRSLEADPDFLWRRPILANQDGEIFAGNMRFRAAEALEWTEIPVILEEVPDELAKARALRDNNEWGDWQEDELAALLQELGGELAADVGFDDSYLKNLLDTVGGSGSKDPDQVPELAAEAVAQLGDLWLLGDHRLQCGDSTQPDEVKRLMNGKKADLFMTDPPYAIYGSATGLSSDIADDRMVRPFFLEILRAAAGNATMWAHIYICCDWRSWPSWWEMAKRAKLAPKNLIVWDKELPGLGSMYGNAYELVAFFALLPPKKPVMTSSAPTGQRQVHKPNVWRGPYVRDRDHNAQKPVDLFKFLIENSTDAGDLVLDLFCGAGTAIIAAEEVGRHCYAMDIDPSWIDVTVRRWEEITGRKARKAKP